MTFAEDAREFLLMHISHKGQDSKRKVFYIIFPSTLTQFTPPRDHRPNYVLQTAGQINNQSYMYSVTGGGGGGGTS